MKTTVPVRRPPGRLLLTALVIMALLPLSGLLNVQIARAAYVNRFSTITNGAITFTGNTLGLSKQAGANAPGIRGGIGAFITTNIALVDGTYPAGTTPDWRLDSAAAVLNIPAGSNVLYAELIWSGSYSYGGENVSPFLNNPVNLTAPGGAAVAIAPDPATANTLGNANANGTCASDTDISPPVVTPCFYVRSANVTAQVQAAGAGTYVVGGVPGTQADTPGSAQETRNNTGWTLAVVYGNPGLPARNLTLFVGAEVTNSSTSTPVGVAGFCTPPTGPVAGRLLVSATEGDADIRGDQMRFGPTAATLTPLSGPNNPVGNFFGSQLNGDTGTVDTTGTFGARNQNAIAGTNISGGRQGWDITNVNISGQLTNAQTSAVAQGTSTGDQYVVNALATQIDVGAPNFPIDVKQVDKVSTFVGDTLTYTIRVDNGLGTADAINVLFKDPPPAGTSFVPNSFTIDGVAQPGADPAAGVNLGTIAMGTQKIVGFQVHVDQLPNPIHYDNSASWTYQYVSCAGQQPLNGNIVTNQVRTDAPLLQPTKTVAPTGTVKPGDVLTYTITAPNSGTAATSGATLADPIPAGATYVPGSTTLNGAAVADVGGAMPFATAKAINGPGAPAGQIAPGAAATVQFKVTVNAGVTAPIVNVATVDPDGPTGPMPPTDVGGRLGRRHDRVYHRGLEQRRRPGHRRGPGRRRASQYHLRAGQHHPQRRSGGRCRRRSAVRGRGRADQQPRRPGRPDRTGRGRHRHVPRDGQHPRAKRRRRDQQPGDCHRSGRAAADAAAGQSAPDQPADSGGDCATTSRSATPAPPLRPAWSTTTSPTRTPSWWSARSRPARAPSSTATRPATATSAWTSGLWRRAPASRSATA